MRVSQAVGIGLLGWTAILGAWSGAAALSSTDDREVAARLFADRVERYVRLRARLEEPLPPFDLRRDPWSLLLTRRYLASAIRTARVQAKAGDVFGPPVDGLFRDTITTAIYEIDIEGLVDGGESAVDLLVNEPVPEWAFQAVPRRLLERLPPLPPALAYRIACGALVLWDEHAEIVVDALPDAFVTR
ncbi:MAG: hypothetical protein A3I61_10310 [Acidobacteria bacterium RIFCSPLOWO2_02_FULL_68_18]|nr:MAG: hypothetical protein A3I61_10310 [Acidobacteria bacterium RIFCSPLOWO2_02_FULL_68_18]OFW48643.1 MAG: hypothetical protein A3G77_14140 [Acidobacteria bacterium RIFCSPLOWO2_12_FULL_68_19]